MTGSVAEVARAIRERDNFILTSHARPDGDAIGSQVALAFALQALGKRVRMVDHDAAPGAYQAMPGVDRIEIAPEVDATGHTVVVLECSELGRSEVAGLDRGFVINIDHHQGNTNYGAVNWYDTTAAACAELVGALIDELGVPWTREIATHIYLGIVTDTGGFRHAGITARTFEMARRVAEAGVDVAAMARQIFDSFSLGRVRLTGAILSAMEIHYGNRVALLYLDDVLLQQTGATMEDTDSLVNLPLGARDVVAVAFIKRQGPAEFRVSFRSKGAVDVRAIAATWSGGGHKNAAGCTITGTLADAKREIVAKLSAAIGQ